MNREKEKKISESRSSENVWTIYIINKYTIIDHSLRIVYKLLDLVFAFVGDEINKNKKTWWVVEPFGLQPS